jgi:hypothetical protein
MQIIGSFLQIFGSQLLIAIRIRGVHVNTGVPLQVFRSRLIAIQTRGLYEKLMDFFSNTRIQIRGRSENLPLAAAQESVELRSSRISSPGSPSASITSLAQDTDRRRRQREGRREHNASHPRGLKRRDRGARRLTLNWLVSCTARRRRRRHCSRIEFTEVGHSALSTILPYLYPSPPPPYIRVSRCKPATGTGIDSRLSIPCVTRESELASLHDFVGSPAHARDRRRRLGEGGTGTSRVLRRSA